MLADTGSIARVARAVRRLVSLRRRATDFLLFAPLAL
jgi:hypothetical protein